MTPYREASPPKKNVFEMRPEPVAVGVMMLVVGPFFALFGFPIVIASVAAGDPISSRLAAGGFGLAFAAAGVILVLIGFRGVTTKVRFSLDADLLCIEWRRRGVTNRIEKVRREDLVDVGLDSTPSSGNMVHLIVVGTRAGDIPLTQSRSNFPGYKTRVASLAAFLGVPVRPT